MVECEPKNRPYKICKNRWEVFSPTFGVTQYSYATTIDDLSVIVLPIFTAEYHGSVTVKRKEDTLETVPKPSSLSVCEEVVNW